jgi:predicted MFS family arabinose efflux permease
LIALVGTLNPSSGDVSVFLPLEHAVLSRVVDDRKRTATFARYSLAGSLSAAVGSLAAGLPGLGATAAKMSAVTAMQGLFVLYALLAGLAALVYRGLPRALVTDSSRRTAPLTKSKKTVYTLAALFSLDAFGGGFVVQSMLALWLYRKFDLSLATAGTLFFWTGILTAASYLVAVRIAKRIGLVNTMVFTHIPSSLCLIAIPFMNELHYVIALLFVRSALSQMDVPTRSSYVMAIVPPDERPAAASITSVPRSLASAASPFIAGYLLNISTFGWPLLAAGALKIVYDMLLLAMFRKVRPPEEQS